MNPVLKTKKLAEAFTLTEIMIVVSIIALLATVAVPALFHARSRAQENTCVDNLRLLDGAKQQWALENKATSKSTPTGVEIIPYLGRGGGTLPLCPSDPQKTFATSYSLNDCSTAPTCLLVASHALP